MTRRERRQKMRFIENQGVGFGQNLGHALLPQAQIRQKQMVIDDDDARAAGAFAGAIHIAFVVVAAFLAEAVFARRGRERPQRRIGGDAGRVGDIAVGGGGGEALDFLELVRMRDLARAPRLAQAMAAKIIGAPFQERDIGFAAERGRQNGQIAEQLFLQGAGSGRHDGGFVGAQNGREISECFADAGAGFERGDAACGDGFFDRGRHFDLPRARLITRQRPRQRAVWGEVVFDFHRDSRARSIALFFSLARSRSA